MADPSGRLEVGRCHLEVVCMRVYVGTSGYQYRAFRGSLYSERCREADMLVEYGSRLSSVEINNTFYRMPKPEVLQRWVQQVPADFRFTIKASQRITHRQRLKDCAESVAYLADNLQALGELLGVVLYQLPPYQRLDLPRLQAFLACLPVGQAVAMEFRHHSWFCDEAFELLRGRNVALCHNDSGEGEDATPREFTADFSYARLRREHYSQEELQALADGLRGQPVERAFAYFKHEESGGALALTLQSLLAAGEAP